MSSRPLVSLLIVAIGIVALPSVASADHRRCPRGGTTVVSNDEARVWQVRRSGISRYYGCARDVGRVYRVDPRGGQLIDAPTTTKLAGTTLAYEVSYFDLRPYRILVRSLRTGKVLHSATSNSQRSAEGHTGPASRVLVKHNGSVAWTTSADCVCEGLDPAESGWEVHAINRDGRRVMLDSGRELDAGSLRFTTRSHRAIAWTNGGETRTAPLR